MLLNAAGHDAVTVLDQQMGGYSDIELAEACRVEDRAIITMDLDFADIRNFPPARYAGLIVFRLSRLGRRRVLKSFQRLLAILDQEPLTGKLWIVEEMSLRIRG